MTLVMAPFDGGEKARSASPGEIPPELALRPNRRRHWLAGGPALGRVLDPGQLLARGCGASRVVRRSGPAIWRLRRAAVNSALPVSIWPGALAVLPKKQPGHSGILGAARKTAGSTTLSSRARL